MFEKENLIKVVKNKENIIQLDETNKLPGRGAYVCKKDECIQKCTKTRGFNRAFKGNVPHDIYDKLKK